ncbi:MAG: 50S ribosomal protein L32 [Dehalococcoidia bacterium]|nr:50S ribosomal protein L32 [Dehalococcoidia bacterium]
MGALPKKKVSRRRRNNRRQHHALRPPQLVRCRNCGEYRLSHHACPHCGTYRGREVLDSDQLAPGAL